MKDYTVFVYVGPPRLSLLKETFLLSRGQNTSFEFLMRVVFVFEPDAARLRE